MTNCFAEVPIQKTWNGRVMARLMCELQKGHDTPHQETIGEFLIQWTVKGERKVKE